MTETIELEEAIANCDRSPIHIPGTVQSFGALLALDAKFTTIEFASQNTKALLGHEASTLLGQSISELLDDEEVHQARNCLAHVSIQEQREVVCEKAFLGNRFQLSIHLKDCRSVLEFLPLKETVAGEFSALEQTRLLFAQSIIEKDTQSNLDLSVENLRGSTGFDRVTAYQFLPNGAGEIVAESRATHMDSFLGLRFPATDIPPIARKLYTETPIRVLADVHGTDIPIIGQDPDARPLDLSLAILRGTANVHLQFLKNMGVSSTLTLPIIVEGKLWGLFAMHHEHPRTPDANMLLASELAGKMLGLTIQQTTQIRHRAHMKSCAIIGHDLLEIGEKKQSMAAYWENANNPLASAISSDGAAYIVGNRVKSGGNSPSDETCLTIRDLTFEMSGDLNCFDDLTSQISAQHLDKTRGALVITLSKTAEISLILFRNEASQKINWAGAPEKEITRGKQGLELNPRRSFSKYIESIEGKCEEWTSKDIDIATVLRDTLVRMLDIQTPQRLKLMIQELNHRVRNILSLVQSLSMNLATTSESIEDYATALEQRIVALAGAHNLLTHENLRGIPFRKLAELELKPYMENRNQAHSLSGPDVVLKADVSPIVALVLHELTSNSVKYGALSVPGGTVSLKWQFSDFGLDIEWAEAGGPPVMEPTREGFGSSIIKVAIPYEFGGKAHLSFESSGVRATFSLPKSDIETVPVRETRLLVNNKISAKQPLPKPVSKRGLIVEDNFVIAIQAKKWFEELGFRDTVAVATVSAALLHLEKESFHFCLLDVNLRGEMSAPVAHRLQALGIPYLFASGYGSEGAALCNQFDVPFLTKPINIKNLRDVINKLGIDE